MTGIPIVTKGGPRSYKPVESIAGGQVVEARAGGVGVAAAGSAKVLGVAVIDAVPEADIATAPTVVNGRSVLNTAVVSTVVAVADAGDEVPVTYAAAAQFGDRLIAAANGQVTPAAADAAAATIIGTCTEPDGVSAAGTGRMRTV